MDKKQHIKCDVHSCKHCDCSCDCCKLRELEINLQSGLDSPNDIKDTVCSNYENKENE